MNRLCPHNIKLVLIFLATFTTIYSLQQYFLFYTRNLDVGTPEAVHIFQSSTNEFSKDYDTHPLENFCKYAILDPFEPIVLNSLHHLPWEHNTCKKVLPDIVKFQNGFLSIDQQKALEELNHTVICRYRPFAGTLKPRRTEVVPLGPWTFVMDRSDEIFDDQIEVQCYNEYGNESELDYQFAFAQVHPYLTEKFEKNTDDLLNINIIVLDSTSLSAFRRHMPKTLRYFRDHMGAMLLEGHIKVADNSLVNLLPLLTGLRYGNQSEGMPSDFPLDVKLEVETIPLLWNDYRDQNCATFLNVDPADYTRGLFQYDTANGMKVKPTTYWYRPWHVYHRKLQLRTYNTTRFCFGNELAYELQLALTEQMTKVYNNTCHFAFTFITDLPHDDCHFLELIDEQMKSYLHHSMTENLFNKSVLIIMGDHGQRLARTMYTFFGRIEERAPLFGIYFPEWVRNKYPQLMNNFHLNRNRLTSHYDVYQVLKDIAEGNFGGYKRNNKIVRENKGVSLLHNVIPSNRTCKDANIPIQHCACLIPHNNYKSEDDNDYSWAYELIVNYTQNILKQYPQCKPVEEIEFKNVSKWTMSQMIQWGVRNLDESDFGYPLLRQGEKIGLVDYYEVEYLMKPFNITALIRLQNDRKNKIKKVNVDPLVKDNFQQCNDMNNSVPKFCVC